MSDPATSPGFQDGNGFRALTELAPDLVAVIDVAGVLSYLSPSIERILGYLPGEIVGRPFLELVDPEDQHTAREDWARLLASDDILAPTNIRFRHKDGSLRILEALMKNYSGAPGVKWVLARQIPGTSRGGNCGGAVRIVASIEEPTAIRAILAHFEKHGAMEEAYYRPRPCGPPAVAMAA